MQKTMTPQAPDCPECTEQTWEVLPSPHTDVTLPLALCSSETSAVVFPLAAETPPQEHEQPWDAGWRRDSVCL